MTTNLSNGSTCVECTKMKEKNQRLVLALVSIANEEIKKAENGIKYIKERKEMTEKELIDYYKRKINNWQNRKKSYLFQK